uniref:Uncharacterized protein n=1 Tax=Cajanus cajan TaxID=3821 RepID=A0A151T5P2_CAJCA|nr:hypothetical protein KK1_016901 [Cajanus cajan]
MRIYDLPQKYCSPRIIFSIASIVGVPFSIDQATMLHAYGHFAQVLVEINLVEEIIE